MRDVMFTVRPPGCDRRHYVDADDIRIVLARLPAGVRARLRAVHFNDRGRGRRRLGYVNMGHREIGLSALPPRVSLAGALHRNVSPAEFGAARGCQWPPLAVRRFMLYDVFLHELGHLQLVNAGTTDPHRRFAGEALAQRFADEWRRRLWSRPFDHPDPVHNPPSADERRVAAGRWADAHREYQRGRRADRTGGRGAGAMRYARAVVLCPRHARALEQLAVLSLSGTGTPQSDGTAARLAADAVRADPGLSEAHLAGAIVAARRGRRDDAERGFQTALRLAPNYPFAAARYGAALARWGRLPEAERLFRRALRLEPEYPRALAEYALALVRAAAPADGPAVARAAATAARAVAADPQRAAAHYALAAALSWQPGEHDRAIRHARRALELWPDYRAASDLLARLVEDGMPDAQRP